MAEAAAAVKQAEGVVVVAQGKVDPEDEENSSGLAKAQAAMDAFEPEYEDAPEPEEGEEKGEPVLVNKEEKDGLDAALAEAQAAVDSANAGVADATAALATAEEALGNHRNQFNSI